MRAVRQFVALFSHSVLSLVFSVSLLYIINSLLYLLQLGKGVGLNYLTIGICAFFGIPGVCFTYALFFLL